ncbi:MAG: tRNA lysidine(34) synthetase TilS [Allorhizobium sp.]
MSEASSPLDATLHFLKSLQRPARLLVAISGGSDSTGLLLALHGALVNSGDHSVTLCAATIDHGLRAGSAEEAVTVSALCTRLGIPHVIKRWNDPKPVTGIAAKAREARYRLLSQAAREFGAGAVLTAHTLEDQAETIAMRAARSDFADTAGLSGMADAVLFDRRTWILRPFLNVRRADIRAFLTAQGQSWIDDPGNIDRRSERVRIRQAMAEDGGACVDGQAAQKRRQLSEQSAAFLRAYATVDGGAVVRIDPEGLAADPDILRHVLAGLIAVVGGRTHGPGRDTLDRLMARLAQQADGRFTAGRTMLERRGGTLYLMRECRGILSLTVPSGEAMLWDGRLRVSNHGNHAFRVEAGIDPARAPDLSYLPGPITRRACRVMPRLTACDTTVLGPATLNPVAQIEVALGPYDHFLTGFDLAFADEIAAVFGRAPYPPPPIQVLLT